MRAARSEQVPPHGEPVADVDRHLVGDKGVGDPEQSSRDRSTPATRTAGATSRAVDHRLDGTPTSHRRRLTVIPFDRCD